MITSGRMPEKLIVSRKQREALLEDMRRLGIKSAKGLILPDRTESTISEADYHKWLRRSGERQTP